MMASFQSSAGARPGGEREPAVVAGSALAKKNRVKSLSKKLSFILRHGAEDLGITIGADGYVSVNEMLRHKTMSGYRTNQDEICEIVATCPKKRFELRGSDRTLCIRAAQGHSLKSVVTDDLLRELTLEEVTNNPEYAVIIHGTCQKFVGSIMGTVGNDTAAPVDSETDVSSVAGLSRCKRNHVHLSLGFPAGFDASKWCSQGSVASAGPEYESSSSSAAEAEVSPTCEPHVPTFDRLTPGNGGAAVAAVPVAISGIRFTSTAVLFIDIVAAMRDGIKFFRSTNDVILTPGDPATGVLSAQYISDVIIRKQNGK